MDTILIIEDNTYILENLTEFLEMEGFRVLMARNGRNGIELAKEFIPNLIICDIVMPEMNGYEVLQSLLGEDLTNAIAFIFSTSKCEMKDKVKALELGADAYISKPFELESLLTITKTFIKSGSKRFH